MVKAYKLEIIYAEYNMYHNSIDICIHAGYWVDAEVSLEL